MTLVTKNILETGIRVLEFQSQPGVPTTNARATALFTQLGTEVTAMQSHATTQAAGAGVVHSGAVQRREIAKVLRAKLREITDTAKGLDEVIYPGAAAQFRMPRGKSYHALLAAGNAFLEDIGAIKAGFTESGLRTDFDEQLADVVASFAIATTVRDAGLAEQIRGTSGVDAQATVVRRTIGKLRAVMNNLLASNPGLLSAWKSASRIRHSPVSEDEGGGSSSTSSIGGSATSTLAAAALGIPAGVEPRVNGTDRVLVG